MRSHPPFVAPTAIAPGWLSGGTSGVTITEWTVPSLPSGCRWLHPTSRPSPSGGSRDRSRQPHRDGSPVAPDEAGGAGDPPGVPTVAALRVVLVEDDPGDAFLVRELLELAGGGYDLVWCRT